MKAELVRKVLSYVVTQTLLMRYTYYDTICLRRR